MAWCCGVGRHKRLTGWCCDLHATGSGRGAAEGSLFQQQQQQQQQRESSQNTPLQLQKALQCERRQLRQLRAAYTGELGRRNELQTLLLDSIQQAKQQYRQAQAAHAAQMRPATASSSAKQQRPWSAARAAERPAHVTTAGTAAAAAAGVALEEPVAGADEGVLEPQAWCKLLDELLSRQQVLELLLHKACPDLVAAAQQLHHGQAPAAPSQPLRQAQRYQQADRDRQVAETSSAAEQEQDVQGLDSVLGGQPFDAQQGAAEMSEIHEDDGGSEAGSLHSSSSSQRSGAPDEDCWGTAALEEQQQQQGSPWSDKQVQQQEAQRLPQQPYAGQQSGREREAVEAYQQQQLLQQASQVQQEPQARRSPPAVRQKAGSSSPPPHAVDAAGPPYQVYRPPAGVHTLGSMSGPVMGSFPVRKLLHNSSMNSHGSQHIQTQQQHRRPESVSAAAGKGAVLFSWVVGAVQCGLQAQQSFLHVQQQAGARNATWRSSARGKLGQGGSQWLAANSSSSSSSSSSSRLPESRRLQAAHLAMPQTVAA